METNVMGARDESVELFIGVNARLLEIIYFSVREKRALGTAFERLRDSTDSPRLTLSPLNSSGNSIVIQKGPLNCYCEGRADHTLRVLALQVSEEWLRHFCELWHRVTPNDDPYNNHQFRLNTRPGNRKHGWNVQIEHQAYASGGNVGEAYRLQWRDA